MQRVTIAPTSGTDGYIRIFGRTSSSASRSMAAFCQRSSSSTGECYHCRGLVKVGGVVHAAIRTLERLGFPDVQLGVLLLAMPLLMRDKVCGRHFMILCSNTQHPIYLLVAGTLFIESSMRFPPSVYPVKDRFYLTPDNIPSFLTWVYWISPMRWGKTNNPCCWKLERALHASHLPPTEVSFPCSLKYPRRNVCAPFARS